MTAVFISYSRQDQGFVHRLHEALTALDRDAWVDWKGIAPTAEWLAEIRRAIDGADAALFVISPAWVASQICGQELEHAVQQGKRLVPVLWRDAPSGSVPEALAKLNWVMLREGDDFAEGVRQLVAGLDVDLDWVREHTRLIVRAQEWEAGGHDDARLLRGRELEEAERWLAAGANHTDPAPVPLQASFITRSREAALRRQRTTRSLVLAALVTAIGLAIWALIERGQAIEAQHEAERQRDAAQARQLAARAEAQAAADPALMQRSALLAAESLRILPNLEADQVLRRTIARLPVRHAELPHAGIIDVDAVSSAGVFIAFADAKRVLRVVHAGHMREIFRFDTGGRTRHVHVDRGGRYVLLTNVRDGTVLLFTNGDSPRHIEDCGAVGAAFGGESATLLAIGCHRDLRVIDAADAAVPVRVFDEAGGTQLALAFSPNGEHLAGVDEKGDITVWNVDNGKRIARVRGQDSSTTTWSLCCTAFIDYSASGEYIAASNLADNELHVVSTETWQTHARLAHDARVNVFAFDERRDLLASGDRSGRVTVWDVPRRTVVARMSHADEITHLRLYATPFGNSEPELLSASTDRTARVWDPFSGIELARASQIAPIIWVGRPWEPHFGRRFVTLDNHTGLAQWDTRPPPPPLRLSVRRGNRVPVLSCSEPDGQRHWLADASGLVAWDIAQPHESRFLRFFDTNTRPVAIDPSCRWVAVTVGDELRILDPAAPDGVAGSTDRPLFAQHLGSPHNAEWRTSQHGALLALLYRDAGSQVWRTSPWSRLEPGEGCDVGSIVISPDEKTVAFGCGESVRVFAVATGGETARIDAPGPAALTDTGQLVLLWGDEMSVRQLPAGQLLARADLPESNHGPLTLDGGGRIVAVASGHTVGLWSVPTLERKAIEERSAVVTPGGLRDPFSGSLQFSPDGRHLLVHGLDRILVFDTEPWAARSELIHPGEAELVQWDLTARRLMAQVIHRPLDRDEQYSVRVWNMDNGAELLRVPLERAAGTLSIAGEGRWLIADQVHSLSSEGLVDTVCRLVERNLTRREWQAEFGSLPYRRTCPERPEPPPGTPAWDQ